MEGQRQKSHHNIKKKNKFGRLTLSDFKSYNKATITKTAWYWQKNRHIHQQNRIYSPEIDQYKHNQWIFEKRAKLIQWRKDSLVSKWCRKNWTFISKNTDLDRDLTFYKNQLKVEYRPNVKCKCGNCWKKTQEKIQVILDLAMNFQIKHQKHDPCREKK